MPELSRSFGIIIRMFSEPGAPHNVPHFHAYYQDGVAVFGIDPVDRLAGEIPRRQRRLVEPWAELHQTELLAAWALLHAGRRATQIEPLK